MPLHCECAQPGCLEKIDVDPRTYEPILMSDIGSSLFRATSYPRSSRWSRSRRRSLLWRNRRGASRSTRIIHRAATAETPTTQRVSGRRGSRRQGVPPQPPARIAGSPRVQADHCRACLRGVKHFGCFACWETRRSRSPRHGKEGVDGSIQAARPFPRARSKPLSMAEVPANHDPLTSSMILRGRV